MNLKVYSYIWRVLSLFLASIILSCGGCGGDSSIDSQMDIAENIMESRPDSALGIMDLIHTSQLRGSRQKARYGLLKSMALDKNYIDTTVFDVLQPAIDYYLKNGSPDEKLRTYYYQGRIFQNRNERDGALHSFMKGLDLADRCKDSLSVARTLRVQASMYKSFYDYAGYVNGNIKAAEIYKLKSLKNLEFECLTSALNGLNILNNKERADSIIQLLDRFDSLNEIQRTTLSSLKMTYAYQFGSKQDLKELMDGNTDSLNYDANGILNLARAYSRLEDDAKALLLLNTIDNANIKFDTLKYLSIKCPLLERQKNYEGALSVYKDLIHRVDILNTAKFEQKSQSMEEKHRMELEAEKEARRHSMVVWGFIGGISVLVMVMIIMVLLIRSSKIKKNLALEQVRSEELKNKNLKVENELALEKARTTEAENGKLKSDKELALEKAHTAELENQNLKSQKEKLELANANLQLEHDKKALEAENLAHRVTELEGESEGLKELLESQKEMPEEVRKAIQKRIEMLNSYLASQISDHKEFEKAYDAWVAEHTANIEEFMNSNRLAFQVSHPKFIRYFEDHDLTVSELNYVCLYAIGLRGKDVGNYMKKRSHVNISSAIRKKLGIDKHETNIGIYVRKLLQSL